jgi:hypothetical protein
MSELWINFLQKEAAARETPGTPIDGPLTPLGGTFTLGGSAPGSPTPMMGKR